MKLFRGSKQKASHEILLVALLLAAVTVAAYWKVLGYGFTMYDDDRYVTENHHVRAGLTLEGVRWAFSSTEEGNWHPLTWISHMVDCRLYGVDASYHHLTNVILHTINSVLLFLLFTRLTGAVWRSAFLAAVFALHPLHVESVAWIAERKDVLSTMLAICALWFYSEYVERKSLLRYFAVVAFFTAGLMAKPMLVSLPFVLLLMDYWPLRRFTSWGDTRVIAKLIGEKAPLFLLSLGSGVVTYKVQQAGGTMRLLENLSLDTRVVNVAVSYVRYIGKTVWPTDLAVIYPHPGVNWDLWQFLGSLLFLAGISTVCVIVRKKAPHVIVGWLWFLGTLVPVIGFVQVGI